MEKIKFYNDDIIKEFVTNVGFDITTDEAFELFVKNNGIVDFGEVRIQVGKFDDGQEYANVEYPNNNKVGFYGSNDGQTIMFRINGNDDSEIVIDYTRNIPNNATYYDLGNLIVSIETKKVNSHIRVQQGLVKTKYRIGLDETKIKNSTSEQENEVVEDFINQCDFISESVEIQQALGSLMPIIKKEMKKTREMITPEMVSSFLESIDKMEKEAESPDIVDEIDGKELEETLAEIKEDRELIKQWQNVNKSNTL